MCKALDQNSWTAVDSKDRELWKKATGNLRTWEMTKQGRERKGDIWCTFAYTGPFFVEECFNRNLMSQRALYFYNNYAMAMFFLGSRQGPGTLCLRARRPGPQADHSCPSNSEFRNVQSNTSTARCAFTKGTGTNLLSPDEYICRERLIKLYYRLM
jgi:hypothetical protein